MPNESDPHRNRYRQPSRQSTRVLVVDDHPDIALTLARMLQICGYEVKTACNGRAALEIAAQFRPRFVLLDLGLPILDGYEVARRLRAETGFESPTLIAVTCYGEEEARERSREAGIDHHLLKPVDPGVLLGLLSQSAAESPEPDARPDDVAEAGQR
jgi:two-component system CheB/CheR fusion protein